MTTLQPANFGDAPALLDIEHRSFQALLGRYQDYGTNPAMEPLEHLAQKLASPDRDYWFILEDGRRAGFISVKHLENSLCVSPIGLLPEYQGMGAGHRAMTLLEEKCPENRCWELETISQEPGLRSFYESLGYQRTRELIPVKPGMELIGYKKTK